MATRKALVLVSGLFQELNSSADKLDFAGNSTSDLSEGTNEYFTQARARGSVSVASGNGLTYNSSTGVIGTSAIPNSQLANDDITIGSTAVALGATQGTFTGLTSLASTTLISDQYNHYPLVKLSFYIILNQEQFLFHHLCL